MKTRISITSIIVGLLLLSVALVRYVTARDVQRMESIASQQDALAIIGLLVGGVALITGGVAALSRWSRPAMTTLAGLILLGAAGVLYLHACDVQKQEQAVRTRLANPILHALVRSP
jgi:uncharacterized membrane protein